VLRKVVGRFACRWWVVGDLTPNDENLALAVRLFGATFNILSIAPAS